MKYFIHIRGTNAAGKTSTARSVIAHGDYRVEHIRVAGKDYPYTFDEKRGWIVTGRYDKCVTGGLDGVITNKNVMELYLTKLMKEINPNVIVFEAVMYGHTYTFGKKISDICKKLGYLYKGVSLEPSFDVITSNIKKRNGGKPVSYEGVLSKYIVNSRATIRLIQSGVFCKKVDPSCYSVDDLHLIVERMVR